MTPAQKRRVDQFSQFKDMFRDHPIICVLDVKIEPVSTNSVSISREWSPGRHAKTLTRWDFRIVGPRGATKFYREGFR